MNAALIALISGVIGARLSHVLENWSIYTDPKRTFGATSLMRSTSAVAALLFMAG